MSAIRTERLNEELKKTISEVIRELKDPRLSDMTTVTSVDMTKDQKYAKVRISVYDQDDAKRKGSVDALNHAAGFIGREVGRRMLIRNVPQMKFILDDSIAYSIRISQLIDSLHAGEKTAPAAEEGTDDEA